MRKIGGEEPRIEALPRTDQGTRAMFERVDDDTIDPTFGNSFMAVLIHDYHLVGIART